MPATKQRYRQRLRIGFHIEPTPNGPRQYTPADGVFESDCNLAMDWPEKFAGEAEFGLPATLRQEGESPKEYAARMRALADAAEEAVGTD